MTLSGNDASVEGVVLGRELKKWCAAGERAGGRQTCGVVVRLNGQTNRTDVEEKGRLEHGGALATPLHKQSKL